MRFLAEFTREAATWGWQPAAATDDHATFTRPHGDGLRAHLALSLSGPDEVWLNPGVGVSHPAVSALTAQLLDLPPGVVQTGAKLTDLVRTTGETGGRKWLLHTEAETPLMARTVLADVERYGQPFLDQCTSLAHLIRRMTQRAMTNIDFAHLAVACAVAEDHSRTQHALSQLHHWMDGRSGLLLAHTERFVADFHAHFGIRAA